MRTVTMIAILALTGLAGCLDDGGDGGNATGDNRELGDDSFPERFFEPEVSIAALVEEIGQGDDANLTFGITDLHDYSYPVTFIDWGIFYERDPNPVLEGDATDLPGEYGRILHAVDYHMFAFYVDDGQGFVNMKVAVVTVGEPDPDTYPNATEMKEFREDIEQYYGALEEEEEPGGEPAPEPEAVCIRLCPDGISEDVDVTGGCGPICTGLGFGEPSGASVCAGFNAGQNGLDCAWIEVPAEAVGASFTIDISGFGGDPDAVALSSCASDAAEISSFGASGGESGTIAEGVGCLLAWEFFGTPGTVEFRIAPIMA